MNRYARLCVTAAALELGLTICAILTGHSKIALFLALLTAAAALTALRELVNREPRS